MVVVLMVMVIRLLLLMLVVPVRCCPNCAVAAASLCCAAPPTAQRFEWHSTAQQLSLLLRMLCSLLSVVCMLVEAQRVAVVRLGM